MYSELISKVVPANINNYQKGRNGHKICKITPHHMSAKWSAQRCGEEFQNPSKRVSSNYGIGVNGEKYGYVDEENRAYTSSSRSNDEQAITIECANDDMKKLTISKATWDSLVELCVDICKRRNFRLEFTGNSKGSLTMHRMFANTDCPGDYLASRMPELAAEVNRRLDGGSKNKYKQGDVVETKFQVRVIGEVDDKHYKVESNGYKFELEKTMVKPLNKDGVGDVIQRGTICCELGEKLYLIEVLDRQFNIIEDYIAKKL